ncbi:type II toxin-antitoxin system VapC family toxin [Nostoc sp. WHI]|uniref:type II toxin-antitoxin system VapC family toxin n=1 Tax=Nostoc sp. WHI TaxID=2650611 RepID=UPI0018C6F7C5|nr:type II toxin-antitoxin system VapC family toxin [Nostoc sp. WHI]MBG1270437.1 type II toxin-antitoxin system VapC family toxin [Nostoc sp. WHI]
MRLIFDTHTFLWWITDNSRLSSLVMATISDRNNELFFSAASAWEIATKAQLGKLLLLKNPERKPQLMVNQ